MNKRPRANPDPSR